MFKKLLEHNIINCNGQYFCHLCMCVKSNLEDVLHHIDEEQHIKLKCNQILNMLKCYAVDAYQDIADNNIAIIVEHSFICIPCQRNIVECNNILQHIQGKSHIKNLSNKDINNDYIKSTIQSTPRCKITATKSNILENLNVLQDLYFNNKYNKYTPCDISKILHNCSNECCKTLINNGIIISEHYQLVCKFCNRVFETLSDILKHINAKKHIFGRTVHKDENKCVESLQHMNVEIHQEQSTSNNKEISNGNLMCKLCMCFLPSEDHILPHVNGRKHKLLESQSTKVYNNEDVICYTNTKISNEKEELGLIETQYVEQATVIVSDITKMKEEQSDLKSSMCTFCTVSSCNNNCLKVQEELLRNGVMIHGSTDFLCTLCDHKIKSLHDILLHIKGRYHKIMCKIQNVIINTSKNITSTNQTLVMNCSSSPMDIHVSQKHSLNNDIYSIHSNTNILTSDTYETISLIDDSNEDKNNEILSTNKNDTTFQNGFYNCELCNIQIDINNLFEHFNTVTHRCNIFSMNMGDDIIMFKCFCCKSVMQGNSLLINHLSSTTHLNNLSNILKYFKLNSTKMFTYTCKSIQNMLENKSFPLCTVLLPEVQNAYTYFNEKCFIFFDTSDIKCNNNIKNNILYNCSFCSVTLNTDHNLIHHCQARMHLWRLKQMFPKKNQFSIDNIDVITKKFSKLSINDKDEHYMNRLDNDFTITNDVNKQIIEHLNASPLKKNKLKKCKGKEKSLTERLNKTYSKQYLEIEEKMYNVQQKLNYIKVNLSELKLIIPYEKRFYCLVCDKQLSTELYLLYEHMCLQSHKIQVDQLKTDTKFKKLSKQFLQEKSIRLIKCHPCEIFIFNIEANISTHIESVKHRIKSEKYTKTINTIFDSISQNLTNLWYSIQRFSCVLCKTNFKYKLEFIEHIVKIHSQLMKDQIFDFCIPCTTLWLDQKDSYTEHCSDIIHKYLIKNQDFMIEDLPDSIKEILIQADEVSDILFQQTQILFDDNIQQEVKQSLENSLKLYFPAVKAYVFGSRVNGLGFASSDIDIYIDCLGNTYNQDKNEYLIKQRLNIIKNILHQHKEEWEVKETLEGTRTPIIKLIYKRTGLYCDISVTNGLSVENSKLIRSFNDAYLPCRKLILFIKKWLSQFNLPEKHGLTNYALAWLVIFYLQSKSHLPSVASLIKKENKSRLICGWETGVSRPKNNKSQQSISTLLVGFFKFYENFDYQHYIICPLIGQPLAKQAFAELHMLPKEMKPYIEHLSVSKNPEYFRIDSPLCVQDPFDLSHNLTKAVTSITLKCFRQYCQDSTSILQSLTK